MRIDNNKELLIQTGIMHILDNKTEHKILSDFEMNLDIKTKEILSKHVINSVNDEYVRFAKFENDLNTVRINCQEMLSDESKFIESSKEIANYLYDAMCDKRISPAYLVISKIKYDNSSYVSILKLDFNENLTSKINEIDGKKRIDIVMQGMGLPNEKQKLHKCIFFRPYLETNEYDIILLDKQAKNEAEIANFFAHNFLHCIFAKTDLDNTKNFCTYANKFIENNFGDNLEKISELKEKIISSLKSDEKINISQFAEATFGENEGLRNEFINYINEKTIDADFKIDKTWVEKNIKRKQIITDTGIEIKIDERTARNSEKFIIEYPYQDKNKANIIIKNVSFKEKTIK